MNSVSCSCRLSVDIVIQPVPQTQPHNTDSAMKPVASPQPCTAIYSGHAVFSSPNHLSINLQTASCSTRHSSIFSRTHDSHKPSFAQSTPLIRSRVSRGLYTPSSSSAGWMTSLIQVSANTSVQAMWGVAAGVKSSGVKWSISWVISCVERRELAAERTWRGWGLG